jgi:hypothetical protein
VIYPWFIHGFRLGRVLNMEQKALEEMLVALKVWLMLGVNMW